MLALLALAQQLILLSKVDARNEFTAGSLEGEGWGAHPPCCVQGHQPGLAGQAQSQTVKFR